MIKNTLNKYLTGFILDRIELKRNHFTPELGQLASYISRHYRDIACMSISELARASRIGLIGLQASASLVEYFYFALEKIASPVVRITTGGGHAHVLVN